MRARCILIAVLSLVACARQFTTVGKTGYTPKWQVGDWWVVKTFEQSDFGFDGWAWNQTRYDVARIEKVGGRDCFVLETRHQGPQGMLSGPWQVFYVRRDDWLVIREVTTTFHGGLRRPVTTNYPLGLSGPLPSEPCLPRFPLQPASSDTAFRFRRLSHVSAWLREISGVADTALVHRLLDEGDAAGGRVLRPAGAVCQVRSELGGNLDPNPRGGERRVVQSLQFWSEGLPWRVYEEQVLYLGQKPIRELVERSWLVAKGRQRR
jgi:hypothetical protein